MRRENDPEFLPVAYHETGRWRIDQKTLARVDGADERECEWDGGVPPATFKCPTFYPVTPGFPGDYMTLQPEGISPFARN
jgi:hypothetical protein